MTDAPALVAELRAAAERETNPELASLLIRAAVKVGLDAAALDAKDTLIAFHRQRAEARQGDFDDAVSGYMRLT